MAPWAQRPINKFFRPRLVHFHARHEHRPGGFATDWQDPKPSWTQQALRCILYKARQARPSPAGLEKLPYELLDLIFKELCGKEVHAVRLVCTEWERASRPFFAELHLKRSVFWVTSSGLRRLESLARRFGPYMDEVYISNDHFTIAGLWRAWRQYLRHRDYLTKLSHAVSKHGAHALLSAAEREVYTACLGQLVAPSRQDGKPSSEYYRHAYQQRQPLSPWKTLRLWSFLAQHFCNVVSQTWLRVTGLDKAMLSRIVALAPNCSLEAVRLDYEAEQLNVNEYLYGRPSPGYAFELALLCARDGMLKDEEYAEHVERVIAEAVERRPLLAR